MLYGDHRHFISRGREVFAIIYAWYQNSLLDDQVVVVLLLGACQFGQQVDMGIVFSSYMFDIYSFEFRECIEYLIIIS